MSDEPITQAKSEAAPDAAGETKDTCNVLIVEDTTPIKDTISQMIEAKRGNCLVKDKDGVIVGIVTERDILRKFALLDVEDKLDRTVSGIMTRPVTFVTLENMRQQAIKLHLENKIRNFPILKSDDPQAENVVGVLTITDLLTGFLKKEHSRSFVHTEEHSCGELMLVAKGTDNMANYNKIFTNLGYETEVIPDFKSFFQGLKAGHFPPAIIDIDFYSVEELKQVIPLMRKYPGIMITATSNPNLLAGMRQFPMKKNRHLTVIKPLDVSYIHWTISNFTDLEDD